MKPRFRVLLIGLVLGLCSMASGEAAEGGVFLADGFKVGEVTSDSVIVWTRATAVAKPADDGVKLRASKKTRKQFQKTKKALPDGVTVEQLEGYVPGAPGKIRAVISSEGRDVQATEWKTVGPERDYCCQFVIKDLKPATEYGVRVEAATPEGKVTDTREGRFKTAPPADVPVRVLCTSVSCSAWKDRDCRRGYKIYDSMRRMKPDFFVHTGDYVYLDWADPMGATPELVCHKWNRQNGLPSVRDFYAVVPSYLVRDDHDSLRNDCWPGGRTLGDMTLDKSVAIWYDHMPIGKKSYRTFRWGKDLQIWIVEGREYRSPNTMPDGPEKTIWGKTQKDWFTRTVTESDATFKILFSPTPVVGPDRVEGKHDNHSNVDFATEGRWLRRFMADQRNMYVINGDRHWQYVSVCPDTGLWEFSQGPASNSHAEGWKPDDLRPEHRFLRVKGGYVAAEVFREKGEPKIRFTHYDVKGRPVHEELLNAK
ncbi:MAG: alkaline phosphatase D family protein [Pirellulales bacterium]|nr:alkaline phosphatase D family protein [Pirellulales bacterium]